MTFITNNKPDLVSSLISFVRDVIMMITKKQY